jgi:hypothetical protein
VKRVSCGAFHTAAVTEDGRLYTWGRNHCGQLGHDTMDDKWEPMMVLGLKAIYVANISCGWNFSVALTDNGEVYSWYACVSQVLVSTWGFRSGLTLYCCISNRGSGVCGRHGHGSTEDILVPRKVEKLKICHAVDVVCYGNFMAALVERSSLPAMDALTIATTMHTAVNDVEFSDVTFKVDDQEIAAHRVVLVRKCPFFGAMFRTGMRESTEKLIRIDDVSSAIFLLILEYLYTDKINIDIDNAVELYRVADMWGLERLRELCCTAVQQKLTVANATMLLHMADDSKCNALREIGLEFVVQNFASVSETDGIKQLSQALLVEIVQEHEKALLAST